jgi:hypothetical protein
VEKDALSTAQRLEVVLKKCIPQLIFLDKGIRLRPTSPIWESWVVQLVVSIENWRGKLPKEWWTTKTWDLSHDKLGGVTNGSFKIRIARSITLETDLQHCVGPALLGKLKHVLDPTVKGVRCPIPNDKTAPLSAWARHTRAFTLGKTLL